MPPSQNEGKGELQSRTTASKVQAELEHWESLVFSFDMDKDNEPPRTKGRSQISRSMSPPVRPEDASGPDIQDLLAQLAGASSPGAALSQPFPQLLNSGLFYPVPPPTGYYNNVFHHGPMGHPQLPPLSSLDFAWHHLAQQQGQHPVYNLPHQAPVLTPLSFANLPQDPPVPQPPAFAVGNGGRSRRTSTASSAQLPQQSMAPDIAASPIVSASSPTATEADLGEVERAVIAEDKRRRNTAASARFRIKKKQRTVNLERSVSDLTGRAEELEKEVTDLRRENGWLKEIVMLKGSHYAAAAGAQQRLASSQAVQAASIGLTSEGTDHTNTSSAVAFSPRTTPVPEIVSSEDSDEDYPEADKKGKGKRSTTKGKKK